MSDILQQRMTKLHPMRFSCTGLKDFRTYFQFSSHLRYPIYQSGETANNYQVKKHVSEFLKHIYGCFRGDQKSCLITDFPVISNCRYLLINLLIYKSLHFSTLAIINCSFLIINYLWCSFNGKVINKKLNSNWVWTKPGLFCNKAEKKCNKSEFYLFQKGIPIYFT